MNSIASNVKSDKRLKRLFSMVALLVVGAFFASSFFGRENLVRADAINATDFVFTVNTANAGSPTTQFVIPITGTGYNYSVDCNNDGIYEITGRTTSYTCTYGTPGTYTIRIGGAFPRIYFNNGGDKLKITQINQWGTIAWTSMQNAFYGCTNLDVLATDTPNLAGVTNMSSIFQSASNLVGAGANWAWSTGTVTDMSFLFISATKFNQNIGT